MGSPALRSRIDRVRTAHQSFANLHPTIKATSPQDPTAGPRWRVMAGWREAVRWVGLVQNSLRTKFVQIYGAWLRKGAAVMAGETEPPGLASAESR
jgi:hypothetical protein